MEGLGDQEMKLCPPSASKAPTCYCHRHPGHLFLNGRPRGYPPSASIRLAFFIRKAGQETFFSEKTGRGGAKRSRPVFSLKNVSWPAFLKTFYKGPIFSPWKLGFRTNLITFLSLFWFLGRLLFSHWKTFLKTFFTNGKRFLKTFFSEKNVPHFLG